MAVGSETAPIPEAFKAGLLDYEDSLGQFTSSTPEQDARIEAQAIFGAYRVLQQAAAGERPWPSTLDLIRGSTELEGVVATRTSKMAVNPFSGTVRCPFWERYGLPYLRTTDGIEPPAFDLDEAWVWVPVPDGEDAATDATAPVEGEATAEEG